MPRKRTNMNKIYDVLRLKFEAGLSNRNIAKCLGMGTSTVTDLLTSFNRSDLAWPLPDELTQSQLENTLYPGRQSGKRKRTPDFVDMHQELKRKGMTKLLLWEEYRETAPETAYGYTQFCEHYQRWLKKQKRSMRQHHIAGDKLFIDYCGPTVPIVNPDTGEVRVAQIFVATLGASNYTYVEACHSQQSQDWLMAHVRAFEFFGGVPKLLVPDNLKAAVTKTHRYQPTINENYARMARHYNTAVMPARPYKPKDKSKAENAVLIVERWILMRLRHQVFHTLSGLNAAIKALLNDLNHRQQKMHPGSRHHLYEKLDKPALMPLPHHAYEYVDTRRARVGPDYHVLYDKHAYSVPHQLVGEQLQIDATQRLVRIYHKGEIVAQHPKSAKQGGFTTLREHMPQAHVKQRWSQSRLLNWGQNIGCGVHAVIQCQFQRREHPEQAIKSCLGILNLSKHYGDARLEAACQKALLLERPYYTVISNLLKHHKEQASDHPQQDNDTPINHPNVRGHHYYQ
ncbi:MAG: IS21 family transposase [Aestuariibacter sp.]